ncbi:MAG: bifunctional riboflavin kinase/FAD synthetase [Chitinophagaceae bacterium]
MKIHQDIHALPEFRKAVVTIGTFDGVHGGHQQILLKMKKEAERIGGETVLITFDPHPRQIVASPDQPVRLINTLEERAYLLQKQGLDHLVIVPFTPDFAAISAQTYVEDFLIRYFHPHTLIIGHDHRFGTRRSGDYHLLEKYQEKGCFQLMEIPSLLIQESSVSSTRIRQALAAGHLGTANELLGYPFFFEAVVVTGNQIGRTLGYPTANLHLNNPQKMLPAPGVYAVKVYLLAAAKLEPIAISEPYIGMMNSGTRPTVGGTALVTEVHLFHFEGNLYGHRLKVECYERVRDEQRFPNLDALKKQLDQDAAHCLRFFQKA